MSLVFGLLVLVLVLWGLSAYSKADPKKVVRVVKPAGGIAAVRSLLNTFSHSAASEPTSDMSAFSNDNPAV